MNYKKNYNGEASAIITRTDFLITNKDGKTTFQFRTPSEGGVEL